MTVQRAPSGYVSKRVILSGTPRRIWHRTVSRADPSRSSAQDDIVRPAWFLCAFALLTSACAAAAASPRLFAVDYQSLVSRADLHYDSPASRSEEGMPIGNGRVGTLVWTTPAALRMQINRNDVFATDSRTRSFPQAHSDYASGCAYVDVRFDDASAGGGGGGDGEDVFAGAGKLFEQHLSVYDGVCSVKSDGVSARVTAWQRRDVIAIEVNDQRDTPAPICIDLRMLRYANPYLRGTPNDLPRRHEAAVQTNAHVALMRLNVRDEERPRIALVQEFRETDFYCSSAVVAAVVGRDAKAAYYNESTVRLTAAAGKGTFTVFIGSAASFDPKQDVEAAAIAELEGIPKTGFARLAEDNRGLWAEFWSIAFVRRHSDDGVADEIEKH
jgi:hypothetical protein